MATSAPKRTAQTRLLLDLYATMLRIRRVEERLSQLFADGVIPGFIHLSIGQESVPAAITHHLRRSDTVAITHRGHGQALAKGIDLKAFLAEMMGRASGICQGRGGSMHIADASVGMLGANGIVAGGIPIAVGSALAHQLDDQGNIAVPYFGDGAIAEGVFHESLNIASLWNLPCLFVCENNGWGEFSRTDDQFAGSLEKLAATYNMDYQFIDALDVVKLSTLAGKMVAAVRKTHRPALLECKVTRHHGHYEGDPQKYRPEEELSTLAAADPVTHAYKKLRRAKVPAAELAELDTRIAAEINRAVDYALAADHPEFDQAVAGVYA
ncbi:MAG: thiamine pyrophosphate-dependent dehydrogenase E1 component subunit alpha [Gammaproteobacteria bacterium]